MRRMMTEVAESVVTVTAGSSAMQSIARFASVERVLAALCITIPLWLVLFDTQQDSIRSSISAYHDMTPPQAYYFPLTIVAMLFLFNGIVKTRRLYNVALGVLVAGVVLFDHDGATAIPHYVSAIGFFALNVIVIVWFSTDVRGALRWLLVAAIAAVAAAWIFVDAFTTFWAESLSLLAIAAHFLLDSIGFRGYSTAADRSMVVPP